MTAETKAEKIRAKLLINEDDLFDSIIELSAEFIKIDKAGRVYITTEIKLKDQYSIVLYLIGKSLANHAELLADDVVDADEISQLLGIKKPVVQARLSDLKKEGNVDAIETGKFKIVVPRIHSILKEISKNVKDGKK